MKIVTSLYVYNFHLIISYLNGGVRFIPFKDNRSRFYNSKVEYPFEIKAFGALTELHANRHVLYGNKDSKLVSIDLLKADDSELSIGLRKQIIIDDISQIAINYKQHNLYAFSDERGIVQVDISHAKYQEVLSSFIPLSFDKIGNPSISNIESDLDYLLVAIRDYGVLNISASKHQLYQNSELRSEDPQDVKRLSAYNLMVVADSEEGVILYDFKNGERIKAIKLPDNDFPQQVEVTTHVIIIKGLLGLYAYYFSSSKLVLIRSGKVGALAIYYDYIFFSSKGKLYSLTLNSSFDKHGFDYDREKVSLELINNKG